MHDSDGVTVILGGMLRPASRYALRPCDCMLVAGRVSDALFMQSDARGYFEARFDGNLYMVSFVARKSGPLPVAELLFCKIAPLYFNQIVIFDRRTIERYIRV